MLDEATIERMTPMEWMKAMGLLWQSLSQIPAAVESPEWHKTVLAERLAKIERGEAEFLTVEETKRRLRDRKR